MPHRSSEHFGQHSGTAQSVRPLVLSIASCPQLGAVTTVACVPAGVCAVVVAPSTAHARAWLKARFAWATLVPGDAQTHQALEAAVACRQNPAAGTHTPLAPIGTPFQRAVWAALRAVPAGQTWTYSQLASACAKPRAVRAVAGACAQNPLAPLVPCHRIVRADGALGGYLGGLAEKRRLLGLEGVALPKPQGELWPAAPAGNSLPAEQAPG